METPAPLIGSWWSDLGRAIGDHPWLTLLVLLNAYFILLYVLVRSGWMTRLNLSLFGPALMVKTQRGRGILDWFARARRFFNRFATIGMYGTFVVMGLMSLLLIIQLWFIFRIPPEAAPSPRLILGIPGINPIIPIGYGILALIFAVVAHEFGHGILARAQDLRVKTMGLLFLVIPIGAFVEPDEDQLRAAPRRVRQKVFAAGPTVNLFFAFTFALVFSPVLMGAAVAVEGAPIQGVEKDGPADHAGLEPGWVVTHVDGDRVGDRETFVEHVNRTRPGDSIDVTVQRPSAPDAVFSIVTRTCQEQYGEEACLAGGRRLGHPDPLNRTVIGVTIYAADEIRQVLANPFGAFRGPGDFESWRGFLYYVSLPFEALQGQFPLAGPFQQFYDAPFHAPTFWFLVNACYWLFWINLMLGLTNALPIVPLDGGYMFRDWVDAVVQRRRPQMTAEDRARIAQRLSLIVALFLLSLVILQFIGPRIAGLF